MLGRTAFLIAAAAAVPVVLKKNKKLADQVGDFMVKTGENLKKGYGSAAGTQEKEPAKVSESVVQKSSSGVHVAELSVAAAIALVDAQQRESDDRRCGGERFEVRWSEAAEELVRDDRTVR